MTDKISEAAKRKACKLANAERPPNLLCKSVPEDIDLDYHLTALARVLQEHSDVAKEADELFAGFQVDGPARRRVQALILPDDPDPVEAALNEWFDDDDAIGAVSLREYRAKHGLKSIKQD